MERDCESELSKLNIEQNACIYHFGASVIHGQRSNILRLLLKCFFPQELLTIKQPYFELKIVLFYNFPLIFYFTYYDCLFFFIKHHLSIHMLHLICLLYSN